MKYYRIFILLSILFVSCTNQKIRFEKLWDIEKTVNYQNFTREDEEKIEMLLNNFCLVEKKDVSNWDSGYSQQFYLIRTLYFYGIIDKKNFLDKCIEVYKRYEKNQQSVSFHTVGYGVCLYYRGFEQEAKNIFLRILEESSENNFLDENEYNLSIAVCNILIGNKIDRNFEIENKQYNLYDDEIISIFCGN